MPNDEQIELFNVAPGEDFSLLIAVASFRDAAHVYWKARTDGTFDEIPEGEAD
jgi:hypothetical protein